MQLCRNVVLEREVSRLCQEVQSARPLLQSKRTVSLLSIIVRNVPQIKNHNIGSSGPLASKQLQLEDSDISELSTISERSTTTATSNCPDAVETSSVLSAGKSAKLFTLP